jgi:hypothetical protein
MLACRPFHTLCFCRDRRLLLAASKYTFTGRCQYRERPISDTVRLTSDRPKEGTRIPLREIVRIQPSGHPSTALRYLTTDGPQCCRRGQSILNTLPSVKGNSCMTAFVLQVLTINRLLKIAQTDFDQEPRSGAHVYSSTGDPPLSMLSWLISHAKQGFVFSCSLTCLLSEALLQC